jgi:hypothetical protein
VEGFGRAGNKEERGTYIPKINQNGGGRGVTLMLLLVLPPWSISSHLTITGVKKAMAALPFFCSKSRYHVLQSRRMAKLNSQEIQGLPYWPIASSPLAIVKNLPFEVP